ncbi:MAG: VCBS repeat-containing protein [Planctomycetes bacterium]|nr:VCBS repeat-containing protein [Planctomycetota bacterium]
MSVSKRFARILIGIATLITGLGGAVLPVARAECPRLFPGDGLYAVGYDPDSIAVGDLDGDGDIDLAVPNRSDEANISILLNNGDGTFAGDVRYGVGVHPEFVAIGDLDGDGDADLAVSNSADDSVSILLNNGDGTFAADVTYGAGDKPDALAIGDLDGDGYADLVVANEESDNVSVLLNHGDGTFDDHVLYDVGNRPSSVAIGDLDGDGDADLAVGNELSGSVSVLLNQGDGTFAAAVPYDVQGGVLLVGIGDLDGDGDPDLATLHEFARTLSILLNDGDGVFSLDASYQLPDTPSFAALGDLDGDGDTDVAITYGVGIVGVRYNNGEGTFADELLKQLLANPVAVGIGDFDADGDADLAVVDNGGSGSNTVLVLLNNNNDGTFGEDGDVLYELGNGPGRVAIADLDGDGDADLAVVNGTSDDISLLLNNGDGTFAEQVVFDPGFDPYSFVITADLDEDGDVDLAVLVNVGGIGKVAVLLNDGNASFTTDGLYDAGDFPAHLLSADLDGDGDADLAVAKPSYSDGSVTVLLNNGHATFADEVTYSAGAIITSMAVGDLDGDGDADLALSLWAYDLSVIQVLWNTGDGTFPSHSNFDAEDDPRVVAIGDVDGDGDADMALTTGQNWGDPNIVIVLLNDGAGSFAVSGSFVVGDDAYTVAIADLDADGDGDLVVVNPDDNNVHVLLNGGGASFDPNDVLIRGVGNSPYRVAVGDLNGDGAPDLAVTNSGSNNVSILLNQCPRIHNLTQGTNHSTIQAAIDSASTGDVIEVDPGTYFENIDFLDKDITVRSTDPLDPDVVADTIIDGGGVDTVVVLSAGEISGFTITGGVNTGTQAGGVHATGTAVVSYNMITGNVADEDGGGVAATDGAVVRNNRITFNEAGDVGGGVNAKGNSWVIDNYIAFNEATSGGGGLGALGNCIIRNNTIVFNSTSGDGGGVLAGLSPVLLNNIVGFSTDGAGIHVLGSDVTADYNCVFGNLDGEYAGDAAAGANDLNVDPQLGDDQLHIQSPSPCINAGDPSLVPLPDETDIDGQDRITFDRVDIGADEAGDCNGNGILDTDDIAEGTSLDCNQDGIPDECDDPFNDCNNNGVLDECDIAEGLSADCNGNGMPDECELEANDCNGDSIPDDCDISSGTSQDCTANGIPDECEPDCNSNGLADTCDLAVGTSQDCNANEIPDECDIASGASEDCNLNEIPDECEPDCNGNEISDECDLTEGTSLDCNANGIPDECEDLFIEQIITTEANFAQSVFAADLDGDGDIDVLSASDGDDKIAWYANTNGLGNFGAQQVITTAASGAQSVFAADLDGDGDIDVLSASVSDDKIAWYENTDGLGSFGPQQIITTQANYARSVFAADLDGDGDIDVLSASGNDDKIAWYENTDGLGSFGAQQIITTTAEFAASVFAADLDGDGDLDVLSASESDDKIAWYENTDGLGSFGPEQIITTTAVAASSVFAADLDSDGDNDVLSASRANEIAWYENTDGLGSFGPPQIITNAADDPYSVFAADLDGDGDNDVLSASNDDNDIAWYENTDGLGSFGSEQIIDSFALGTRSVFAADLDGDGDPDVLSASAGDDKISWYATPDLIRDCNANGVPDSCDIVAGTSQDSDENGIPDECETLGAHNMTQGTSYPTIQQAINSASPGDVIEVDPGAYLENLDFLAKDITVRSTDPLDPDVVGTTTIAGAGIGTVVVLSAGEISGFTITGGVNTGTQAGGVHATGTAVVSYNVITGNVADDDGGGVTATDSAVVRNNRITFNEAGDVGGGVNAKGDSVVIDNYIAFNEATSGGGGLGALFNATIRNNTIVFNSSSGDGGGVLAGLSPFLLNNIVAFSSDGAGIHVLGSNVTADYNCVFGNFDGEYSGDAVAGANDLNVDPLLGADELHLSESSPAIDAGDPSAVLLDGETDIDNEERVSNDIVDIGCDEVLAVTCEGDANGDGTVDPLDSGYVLARFGCPVGTGDPSCDAADQNGDGNVDPLDSGFVLARFGECP